MTRSLSLIIAFVVSFWCIAAPAFGQKSPQLGYMYPPAIKAGTINDVQLGGYDLTRDLQWFFYADGVTLESASIPGEYRITPPPYWNGPRMSVSNPLIAREVAAKVRVEPHLSDGLRYFQTANANGISQTSAYLIRSGELVIENRWRDEVQVLPMVPIGVSGRLSRLTEVDRYRFKAKQNGLVHIELHARRLGANFNAMLQVEDEQHQKLVDVADTLGTDLRAVFQVERGKEYTLSLHDADFRGDASFVYHLSIDDRPFIERCFPAQIACGEKREIECLGWGLASGASKLESMRTLVEVPADYRENRWKQLVSSALGEIAIELPIISNPVPTVDVMDGAELVGAFALSKLFAIDEREQRFRWKVAAKSEYRVELQSMLFGNELDLELQLLDVSGKVLASSEDSLGTTDPGLEYRSPEDTELTLVVRRLTQVEDEVANRYFLSAKPVPADYELTMEQSVVVPLGGKKEWTIKVERRGGHDAEIALEVSGLPEGVTLQGEKKIASGQKEVKWTLEVAANAKVIAFPVTVRGESQVNGMVVRRPALAATTKTLAPLKPHELQVPVALVAITMTPPFDIFLLDKTRQRDTPRGATCVAEMDVVRKEGFDGEVLIEMAAQQSRYLCGSYGLSVKVPAGVKRIEYGAWMSEWLGTEYTMRMATHGVAQVADPQGNMRYVVKATDAPVTMIMEGALLKLAPERTIVTAKLGERVVVPVKISRSPKFAEPVDVAIDLPNELCDLSKTSTLSLEANEVTGELTIELPNDSRLHGTWKIPIRAVSHTRHWPIQAFSEIELRVQ